MTEQAVALFDASCRLGRSAKRQPGAPPDAAALVADLHSFGIAEALVYHADAEAYDVPAGNARLLTEIADYPTLHPCWVLAPHQTGELVPPDELVPPMLAAGVRAARLFPHDQAFAFRCWNLAPLLEQLAAHRVPVWVDFGVRSWTDEWIDWTGLDQVCGAFPALPVVLVRANIASDRRLFPLLERHPNLRFETSYYTVHRGIELVCRHFGPERVLFGTDFPERAAGPAVTALTYSRIGDDERARIAGGNLRELLAGVIP